MATAPEFGGQPPAGLAGSRHGELAPVFPLHPSLSEKGFLEIPENRPRNPVIDLEAKGHPIHSSYGESSVEIFTLANGRHYEVVTSEPVNQRTEIPVVMGTALATSIEGHNWHIMQKFMELGFPVVMVGPEGGHTRIPKTPAAMKRLARNLFTIDLEEMAENNHEILDVTDGYGLYKPGQILKTGESRDAAIGMGINARSPKYERETVYTDAIAACFPNPKPLAVGMELLPRALELIGQVGSLAKQASSDIDVAKALHYPRTVNLHPHFMAHVVNSIPTLVSGKAGELASEMDSDVRMHLTHFQADPWSDPEGWERILNPDDFPNVVHDSQPGDHGAIVKQETQQKRLDRFGNLIEELEDNHQNPSRVNWKRVYMSGRLAVASA